MLDDPILLLIAFVAVMFGPTLQSLAGFGISVIAAPVLVLIDLDFLAAPVLIFGFSLSLLNTLRYRKRLQINNTKLALAGRLAGSVVGIMLLGILSPSTFVVIFSLLIMVSVALTYHRFAVTNSTLNLIIAGFFSGVMGTTTGVGGPPIALVYQNCTLHRARAELGLFFLISTMISLALLAITGNISAKQMDLTWPLLPAVIAGFYLSTLIEHLFKPHYLKPVIAIFSLLSSVMILVKVVVF
ncbi:MAG: sulfite exporter TauE/SafE family protein [Gammaproteobacteria bacterium]|nr:sulfite exporter TauE/SafE family protein [Gammaproteobacteria bacterium]